MKKELNQLTEEQVKKICSIAGKEFASFRCEENGKKGYFTCDIFLKDKSFIRVLSSGVILFIDEKYKTLPIIKWPTIDVVDYLRSEGFYILNKFDKQAVINDNDRLEMIKDYFKNISEEKFAEFSKIVEKYSGIGPTVEEYLSQFGKNSFKSGKIQIGVEMTFSRDGYHGLKLINDPKLNFSLLYIQAVKHPVKKVEKGIRIYRVESGFGIFTIIRSEDESFDNYEVSAGDTVIIKEGDSYSYKGEINLFEININL